MIKSNFTISMKKDISFTLSLILCFPFKMNTNKTKLLEKTYYDLSNSGAYVGPDKLYRVSKFKDITHIGKNTVRKWLHNQDEYSLRREVRHYFRKARVVVTDIDEQFDMDWPICPIFRRKIMM